MPTGIYPRTKEQYEKIGASMKGRKAPWIAKGNMSPHWRGDKAGYSPCHKRVYRERGKASGCLEQNCTKVSTRFEWANLTGNYENVNDYRSMCKSCHAKYDMAQFNLPHIKAKYD